MMDQVRAIQAVAGTRETTAKAGVTIVTWVMGILARKATGRRGVIGGGRFRNRRDSYLIELSQRQFLIGRQGRWLVLPV